ncbi:MAG: hypothetical protein ABJP34_10580 [Erythrobacter sp.]
MNTVTSASDWNIWTAQGEALAHTHRNLLWDIADWLERGVIEFGDAAQEIALVQFGRSKGELAEAMDLAKRFPADSRHAGLSYTHYKLAAKLPDSEATAILDDAAKTGAAVAVVRKQVAKIRETEGGDIHRQMASIPQEQLVDEWYDAAVKLLNRAPNGAEGRRDVCESFSEVDFRMVY